MKAAGASGEHGPGGERVVSDGATAADADGEGQQEAQEQHGASN